MNYKRILLIIGFTILCLAIGFAIWWFLFRPVVAPTPSLPTQQPSQPSVGLPSAQPAQPRPIEITGPTAPAAPTASKIANGGVTATSSLTSLPAQNPFLSPNGSSIMYYSASDGRFYRVTPDGRTEILTDKAFYNVSNVVWAPNRVQAILEYPDQSKLLYNFDTQKQISLPKHWQSFSFSPESSQIAFLSLGLDADNRWLAMANADGSKTQAVEPLGDNADKVQVAWSPNNQIIAFSRTGEPQGLDSQEILFIGKQHENFKSLTVNGLGFQAKWTNDGKKVLYSVANASDDWKPQIWTAKTDVGTIGQNKTPLSIYTWANKCSFGSASDVYCAVPKDLPRGAGLYSQVADTIADNIYKINLDTGATSLIAIPSDDHTINNIIISDDEQYLYFTDKATGGLYKINLK